LASVSDLRFFSKNHWGKSLVHYYAGEQDAALAPDNIAKDETPLCQGRLLLAKKQ